MFRFLSLAIIACQLFAADLKDASLRSHYKFVNRKTNEALTASRSSEKRSYAVIQEVYRGSHDQLWLLDSANKSGTALVNYGSGGVLSVKDCSGELPNLVCLQTAMNNGLAGQNWYFASARDVRYCQIVNALTNKVLAVIEHGTAARPTMVLEKYSGDPRQEWSFDMVDRGSAPYGDPDPDESASTLYIPKSKK